jgi:hypothetical protein
MRYLLRTKRELDKLKPDKIVVPFHACALYKRNGKAKIRAATFTE